jgi:glycine/D-amino acid oxidase-like deaminating enzyme
VAANFLEIHDLLEEAFSHGWTSELEKKGLLHTLFAANHAVEKGYHLSELEAEVIWSALRPEDRERRLYDERLAQSLWDVVLGETDTQQALRALADGLKRFVPKEWPWPR